MLDLKLGTLLVVASFLVFAQQIAPAAGVCCYGHDCGKKSLSVILCDDCQRASRWFCGKRGEHGCNLFGCDCNGGCVKKAQGEKCRDLQHCIQKNSRMDRYDGYEDSLLGSATSLKNGSAVVSVADFDGDGFLDGKEVKEFFGRIGVLEKVDWHTLDLNQDGMLDAGEIDP